MKYHDWAPRTLVALHKQGAAAAAEHASAIAGVFLLRTSHLLDGGEAYDLLERLITDSRMKDVWTILRAPLKIPSPPVTGLGRGLQAYDFIPPHPSLLPEEEGIDLFLEAPLSPPPFVLRAPAQLPVFLCLPKGHSGMAASGKTHAARIQERRFTGGEGGQEAR